MAYLFGDNERAVRRLGILARAFKPATVSFFEAWSDAHGLDPDLEAPTVVDLGCGPGHTTRLVAHQLGHPAIGLDSSEPFLWEARRLGPSRVRFRKADVTGPWPTPPAHFAFGRLLLTHLNDIADVLRTWEAALAPCGWLLVEEVNAIDTDVEPFRRYLEILAAALAKQGRELYVGQSLLEAVAGGALEVCLDRVHHYPISNAEAATLFAMNLRTIHESDGFLEVAENPEIEALQGDLEQLAATFPTTTDIQWGLRQLALRMQ
ncbi:MAG: methyltransferase domain-containing protein [Acidobacteriota bacterium]|nr:methyltransferase domain-containing protein [Acidobacteriota bacterium]